MPDTPTPAGGPVHALAQQASLAASQTREQQHQAAIALMERAFAALPGAEFTILASFRGEAGLRAEITGWEGTDLAHLSVQGMRLAARALVVAGQPPACACRGCHVTTRAFANFLADMREIIGERG
jgi:hypothetical protein